jgi:hypothetical protein
MTKSAPAIYAFALVTFLLTSAMVWPGHVTSQRGANENSPSRSRQVNRNRTMSRSKLGSGDESLESDNQIAQLVLPNLQSSARLAKSGGASASTQELLFVPQEQTSSAPQLIPMVGPVSQDQDLRNLPYIPPNIEDEEERLMRHPPSQPDSQPQQWDPLQQVRLPAQPAAMPTPSATFPGITSAQSACGCLPPDTDGDVGANHYIQSVNSRIKILDKAGTQLLAPTTFNSFFAALGPTTPCGNNQNRGDGVVFYDHMARRWVVSDFAYVSFPGASFYQCVGVSKTTDPVAGGWWLYAVQVDPANPTFLGDYPKFGLWPDAYYFSVNLFSNNTTFNGVRVFALPRSAMINGTGAPNPGAVAFTITPANLGDTYSLVPASFRTGSPPPAGQPEYFMAVNSSAVAGTIENQVFTWRFHVDFTTPASSTFGVGAAHTPDAAVTVNNFVDAFTSSGTAIVPQPVTTSQLDTLGDKLMANLVYQRLGGVESLYAVQTVNNNQGGTGPTGIRWYQFNVTGNTIPATPAQQQTFTNGADGLWRFMPSIAVDAQGNMVVAYSQSSSATEPAIAYAGRLVADPPSTLAQGEAIMQAGGGHQTSGSGRWGDYSATGIDPSDNCTFWHTNEYFSATSSAGWNTRIGKFAFPGCSAPTAAAASIGGQIVTTDGTPLPGVSVKLSGGRSVETITNSGGNYRFDNLQTGGFYTVTPSIANYSLSPGNRSFSLVASRTDGTFVAQPDSSAATNAIDSNGYFVRQQYLDFLGREPDQEGFEYWRGQLDGCDSDADCLRQRRVDVSAAFFRSQEFADTGSFVYRLYKGSLGRQIRFGEFSADRSQVVGGPNLETARATFANSFVRRPKFLQKYQADTSAETFVDALLQTVSGAAGVDLSHERVALISRYNSGGTMAESRALAVREIVDNSVFAASVYSQSFVGMEYFGYLRRDPDPRGFDFWLDVLNNGDRNNYRGMVCSFITAAEYQRRFGTVVTHSNAECGR